MQNMRQWEVSMEDWGCLMFVLQAGFSLWPGRDYNNTHWNWSQWKFCRPSPPIHLSVCSSHSFGLLGLIIYLTPVVCLYPQERKGIMNYCKGWSCKQLSVWNQSLIYWLSMLSHIRKLVAAVEDSPVVQKIYILFTANKQHYADHIKETNEVCVVTVMGWNEVWGWKWFVQ